MIVLPFPRIPYPRGFSLAEFGGAAAILAQHASEHGQHPPPTGGLRRGGKTQPAAERDESNFKVSSFSSESKGQILVLTPMLRSDSLDSGLAHLGSPFLSHRMY